MKKNSEILLLLFLSFFIFTIFFGYTVKNLPQKKNKNSFDKFAIFISNFPDNLSLFYNITKNPGYDLLAQKKNRNNVDVNNINKNQYYEILLYSRYDGDLKESIVEIIDLSNLKKIYTFNFDYSKVVNLVDLDSEEFKNIEIKNSQKRFRIFHPIIDENADIIFHSDSPLIKSDLCGNIIWINDDNNYHHSINIDHEGNVWTASRLYPFKIKENVGKKFENFYDDGISLISNDGILLYEKSVANILIENGYKSLIFGSYGFKRDPVHLNDIEPVLEDGIFWKKGDIFLSPKHLSVIIHYRPKTNKIINMIRGPFFNQHDVDIISNKEISIFNNNNIPNFDGENKLAEILVYNFEDKKFSKLFQTGIVENKIRTKTEGLSDFLHDGSILIEEQNYGKIHIINKNNDLIFSKSNIDKNNKHYIVNWSRVIKNKKIIFNIKNKVNELKCTN